MIQKLVRYFLFIFAIVGLTVCNQPNEQTIQKGPVAAKPMNPVLKKIFREGKLVATTDYNSTNYFIYRGEPMGYQYEMLKSFADYLGVNSISGSSMILKKANPPISEMAEKFGIYSKKSSNDNLIEWCKYRIRLATICSRFLLKI